MARNAVVASGIGNDTTSDTLTFDGGEGVLQAQGTWGGASVTMQYAIADPTSGTTTTPQDTDVVLTSAEPVQGFYPLPVGKVRVAVSGGDGTTSLDVFIGRHR